MDRLQEDDMVETVRVELLKIKQSHGLTNDLLASRIKHDSGKRYHTKTVSRFLQGADPARNWAPFADAAARGWRIGRIESRFVPNRGRFVGRR